VRIRRAIEGRRTLALSSVAVVCVAVAALLWPMLGAGPAPLTSDESLYLSEAQNIAQGAGPRYASGDLVNHRAPLYPALLAAPMKLAGDADAAYAIPKLVVLALVATAFLLGRQAFGLLAGGIAAVLVAASAFVRWLGTTLFLDGTETLFLLLFLAATLQAFRTQSTPWFALSGALLGAAFLTKETAVLWLPLPAVFALLSPEFRTRAVAIGLAAYGATAGALLGGWWLWVYAVTGRVYFWGEPDALLAIVVAGALAAGAIAAAGWWVLRRRAPDQLPGVALLAGACFAGAWIGGLTLFLELTSWAYPAEYWRTAPDYLWRIAAPTSQPWPLLAGAIGWLVWRSREDPACRLLALSMALFLPFTLFVMNREFSYRDLLPVTLVAYVAGAGLAVALVRWASEHIGVLAAGAGAVLLVAVAIVETRDLTGDRLPYETAAVTQANWDNPLVHDTADWIEANVPPDAAIMSSRLYFSHLYVLDEGAHPIHQLPTVRIEPTGGGAPSLRAVTTLFRWEDHRMIDYGGDPRWLYVQRYPGKLYYVGLSERDLVRELREREIAYLVLTGEDAGFSSFAYLDYFVAHPAFEMVHKDLRDERNAVYVFRVDGDALDLQPYQARVDVTTMEALAGEFGVRSAEAVAAAIDPDGVIVSSEAETNAGGGVR